MILAGKMSDLKILMILFGNIPVKEVIEFKELNYKAELIAEESDNNGKNCKDNADKVA